MVSELLDHRNAYVASRAAPTLAHGSPLLVFVVAIAAVVDRKDSSTRRGRVEEALRLPSP